MIGKEIYCRALANLLIAGTTKKNGAMCKCGLLKGNIGCSWSALNAHLELVIPLQLNKPYSPYKNWNEVLLWRLAIPLKFDITSRLSKNDILGEKKATPSLSTFY